MIPAVIAANLRLIGVSGLALVLMSVTTCQGVKLLNRQKTITAAEKTIKAVKDERDACLTNLGTLSAAVDQQNAAVEVYRADSERRLSEATRAVQEAQRAAAGAKRTALSITSRRGSGDLCKSAENVLRGGEG